MTHIAPLLGRENTLGKPAQAELLINVCVARLPFEKSILWPPGSRCGHCLREIRWYDNLPLGFAGAGSSPARPGCASDRTGGCPALAAIAAITG